MIKAQICFTLDSDRDKVKRQLVELEAEGKYVFHCCFLPKKIVEDNNLDTWISDMFDEVLKGKIVYTLDKMSNTLNEAIDKMNEARVETANEVNRLFVLDSKEAEGIQDEVMLFMSQKVIYMR